MKERRFSGERLYKISKTIVLITTGISMIVVIVSIAMQGIYELFREQGDYLFSHYYSDGKIDPLGWSITLARQTNEASDVTARWLPVGIVVPVLFFSITALYRYLFPTKPKNHEDQD